MRFGPKTFAAAATVLVMATAGVSAHGSDKPEDILKVRQGLMHAIKMQIGPIVAFAKGKGELPLDTVERAESITMMARMAPMAWQKGSENIKGSETKPAAFGSEKFMKGFKMMEEAAIDLDIAAKADDEAAIKAKVAELGKTCKGCHDDFKED